MGTPILHAQARTTPWLQCTGVTSLKSGTVWWRWHNGHPELWIRDAMWEGIASVPWAQLSPAPPITDYWARYACRVAETTSLATQHNVMVWRSGIYLGTAVSSAVTGIILYGT